MIINQYGGGSAEKVLRTEIFTQSGTWTCPEGVEKVLVRLFGGGGAGIAINHYDNCYGCGGGSGYMAYDNLVVTPGTSYTITIGAGGTNRQNGQRNGGITSFGSLLSANGGGAATYESGGNGGAGGGGAAPGIPYGGYCKSGCSGGNGVQFGGGGAGAGEGGNYYPEYWNGGNGGNGGPYGGGGGAGSGGYSGSVSSYAAAIPGNGGQYGGRGGYGYTPKNTELGINLIYGSRGINGTDTTNIEKDFPGTGSAGDMNYTAETMSDGTKGYRGCGSGGGGYGGRGGAASELGAGGGGGYGARGGDTCGGGGGYGLGNGGNGVMYVGQTVNNEDSEVSITLVSGGGGGGYGKGGDGNGGSGVFGGGGGGGGYAYDYECGKGGDGICIIQYYTEEDA